MSNCLNCGDKILQTSGKREKLFCDSTCRSNYWQKTKRLEDAGKSAEEIVKIISGKKEKSETKKPILPTKTSPSIMEKFALIKQQLKDKKNGK